jgi:hypothetical protein
MNWELREWKEGEAEAVARMQKYWHIQRNRVSLALERKDRNAVQNWASRQVTNFYKDAK